MDGQVEITDDIVRKIASHYNTRLAQFGSDPPMAMCAPLQVDHSVSGWDTVGRLTGLMSVDTEVIDGVEVLALYNHATMLGAENCERVRDGRWTNVSIGADLETGELKELTIVPFSAAPRAAFLAAGDPQVEKEKLKKHLMGKGKLSEKDADEKLSKMSEDDVKKELSALAAEDDEEKKKLAAEEDEKKKLAEKDEEEKEKAKLANMAGKKERLTQLMAKGQTSLAGVQLAAAKSNVIARLSQLKAQTKVTPAELKKIDVDKLARLSKDALAAVFQSFEDREPVIMVGQLGSVKAVEASAILNKEVKMATLEKESRRRFTSLGANRMDAMSPETVRLAADGKKPEPQEDAQTGLSAEDVTSHLAMIEKHLKAEDGEAAMRHLKHLQKLWGEKSGEGMPAATDKSQAEMSALQDQVAQLSSMFTETQELVAALVA